MGQILKQPSDTDDKRQIAVETACVNGERDQGSSPTSAAVAGPLLPDTAKALAEPYTSLVEIARLLARQTAADALDNSGFR
jgi:hypothetical protein